MDIWRRIPSFPVYTVSNTGLVRNELTQRILVRLTNQSGLVYVSLAKNNKQHSRSLAKLVVDQFLPSPTYKTFNTPINLDGDRQNNTIENLVLRPLWFATKYHRQFKQEWTNDTKIQELSTGIIFDGALAAASAYGLLAIEVLAAAMEYTYHRNDIGVWPTQHHFKAIVPKSSQTHIIPRQDRRI